MRAEHPVRKAAAKALRLLQALDPAQLWSYPGLPFEKIHGLIDEHSGCASSEVPEPSSVFARAPHSSWAVSTPSTTRPIAPSAEAEHRSEWLPPWAKENVRVNG